MVMYVDDTTLYCNIDQLVNEDEINVELAKLSEWFLEQKISIKPLQDKIYGYSYQ